ncbi:MAG TPA: glycoside hydrolase family 36 protein [Micromonosporaceae bacterium]|nr:glycoside hydrolase family 36 protein [Micromonosporaceae bacterium]
MFETVAELSVDADRAQVYEHGWQSWSPASSYPVTATSPRPVTADRRAMSYRAETPAPETGFQGEGLLAVDTGDTVHVFAATDPESMPSIRASYVDGRLVVTADGTVSASQLAGPLPAALGAWGSSYASEVGVGLLRPAPTVWCSWYHYFTKVTEADIVENLAAIDSTGLPVDVVQIDDGWESEIGDWLTLSDRFASLSALVDRIRSAGRRAGIWVAPFLVGERSDLAGEHPGWLIAGPDGLPVSAGHNWNQDVYGLDVTHPEAVAYLREVFGWLRSIGIDYFKTDFVYAGALAGSRHTGVEPLRAYRDGVALIREVIGPDAYLLGCGAPILPSVGLVDAMRVSPDIALEYEPRDGDPSQPSQRGAALSTVGRAWQHGRFWVNDPDCIVARPAVERREEWAAVVERYGGLRASSDRIADLDDWGLSTTRRLLETVPPPTPF